MTNRISLLNNLLLVIVGALVSAIITLLIFALALVVENLVIEGYVIEDWSNGLSIIFDQLIHYLTRWTYTLTMSEYNNVMMAALNIPVFSTTLGFAGLGHLVYLANSKSSWLRGVLTIMFFITVVGFVSNFQYFNRAEWIRWVMRLSPYIFVFLLAIAYIIKRTYERLDITKNLTHRMSEVFAIALSAALLSGIFEFMQVLRYDN